MQLTHLEQRTHLGQFVHVELQSRGGSGSGGQEMRPIEVTEAAVNVHLRRDEVWNFEMWPPTTTNHSIQ